MRPGRVFWFFGLSGSGKTTLTTALARSLREQGRTVLLLDGDELRAGLCRDLGFSDEARAENIRRAAEMARLAIAQGQVVLAAFITPREELRQLARKIIGAGRIDLIWVDAPLAVCRQRDPKGLYQKSAAGIVPLLTGVHSAFEPPSVPDLHLATDCRAISDLGRELDEFCARRLDGPAER
ncbi:MAG: adenylyl-sulfate kinase [Lacunisphaera sp.]